MTIGEMRDLMRQKVVPESVLPQNISELLIDDEKELPELDAFTFLNRLRALGISSADFAYLLEGCGAPSEVVEKIKQNPAMNLQGLILTLESSGLTPKKYTEILYTARQIWERTLTVRLDKTSRITEETIEPETEETPEPSFTEIFDKVSEEMQSNKSNAPLTLFGEKVTENNRVTDNSIFLTEMPENKAANDDLIGITEDFTENNQYSEDIIADEITEIGGSDYPEKSREAEHTDDNVVSAAAEQSESEEEYNFSDTFAADFDKIKQQAKISDEQPAELSEELTETLQRIDDNSDAGISDTEADEAEKPDSTEETEITADTTDEETDEASDNAEQTNEEDHRYGKPYNGDTTSIFKIDTELLKQDISKLSDEEGVSEPHTDTESDSEKSPYYKEALTAGAVGAAVLLTAGTVIGIFGGKAKGESLSFAENGTVIFGEIYRSYTAGVMGGDSAQKYSENMEIFGDLLITEPFGGSVSRDGFVYTLTAEKISADGFSENEISRSADILPPDNTAFIAFYNLDGGLAAAFTGGVGDECGYMLIKNGTVTYTVRQDGMLTDFDCDSSTITIGSVYTPHFYRSFTVQDTDVYLPKLGKNEKTVIPPQSILLSGTTGCSYAVSGKYSMENGNTVSSFAALGNPVYAGTDGFAFVESAGERKGLLVQTGENNKISGAETGYFTNAVFSGKIWATVEDNAVCLRDKDFKLLTIVENLPAAPEFLNFSANTLLISGKDGFIAAFNCTDPKAPAVPALTAAKGFINGDKALIYSTENGISLRIMGIENGKAIQQAVYSKTFTAEADNSENPISVGAVLFDGDRCGAAYSYYDGVSKVSEYTFFGQDESRNAVSTLFDDKTGFTAAFSSEGKIYAICAEGVKLIAE